MKLKSIILSSIVAISTFSSCNYLDVVPTEIPKLSDAFKDEAAAERYFLGNVYGYIPTESFISENPALFSTDELDIPWRNDKGNFLAYHINLGTLDASNPYFNLWEGAQRSKNLYKGIRESYIFLENIETVPNLDQTKKRRWIAETHFLIAYYHFCLFRQYGPIVIMRGTVDMNAPDELRFAKREPVDKCIEFIIGKLDEAIANGLPDRINPAEYGRITKVIGQSLKSRVLLYAASDWFNGNSDYASFKNKDGEALVNTVFSVKKWEDAAEAAKSAIATAEAEGVKLYYCNSNASLTFATGLTKATNNTGVTPTPPNPVNFDKLTKEKQHEYDYRYSMVDPANCELIWPFTNIEGNHSWQRHSAIRPYVFNGVSPTLKMVEKYYTKNGLPIDQDPDFDYEGRYTMVEASETNGYCHDKTIKLHLDREARFYASVAYDNGIYEYRGANILFEARKDKAYGKQTQDASSTGYLVKKGVNPKSDAKQAGQVALMIKYHFPLIRLSELYLNYAEALNEAQGPASHATIIPYLDAIRARSGVPGIQQAWSKAKTPKNNFSKEEMREIIRQERCIELSFEGHRCWDVRRWKIAMKELGEDAKGWNVDGRTPEEFYNVSGSVAQPKVIADRIFPSEKYSLWPISNTELQKNNNLVQTDR